MGIAITVFCFFVYVAILAFNVKKRHGTAAGMPGKGTGPYGRRPSQKGGFDGYDEPTLAENPGNTPKTTEHFTYDNPGHDDVTTGDSFRTTTSKNMQSIDMQNDMNLSLTFDTEEVCKGVIYSVILDRKYK